MIQRGVMGDGPTRSVYLTYFRVEMYVPRCIPERSAVQFRFKKHMSKRIFLLFVVFFAIFAARADESWTGIYLQKAKIGYSSTISSPLKDGRTKVVSKSVIRSAMLGQNLEMSMESVSIYSAAGKISTMEFGMESGGRSLIVSAVFSPDKISAVSESGGQKSKKVIPIPAGAVVVEDASVKFLSEKNGAKGSSRTYYVFDASSLSLVKTSVSGGGTEEISINGKTYKATVVRVEDPRAPMTMYLDSKGEMLKATGPMGMEMIPEPKAVAMKIGDAVVDVDIASASAIEPDKELSPVALQQKVVLRITGVDLSKMPSDGHQTVKKDGNGWLVSIHPVSPKANPGTQMIGSPGNMAQWTKPEVRVPSDDKMFNELAHKFIGGEKNATAAASKVREAVLGHIQGNAGIGVMRDAKEIWQTEEGVCRDHAVVMAAILRSIKIPTKLVSGMVYAEGKFYYHAWVEVWNGSQWIGIDSTRPSERLTAGHLKIAAGTVEDAFVSFLLDGAKIEVIEGGK